MKHSFCLAAGFLLMNGALQAATTPAVKPKTTLLAAGNAAPVASGSKTWALLVGVSNYELDQISKLNFPAKDATGLRDALIDPAVGALAPGQVTLLTDANATRDAINGAVQNFLKPNVKPGDKVIVFLAGHGVAKGVGLEARSFLLPTDVKGLTTQALENSAVDLRALANELGALPAAQFVIFVDACREDPTPGRGLKGNAMSDVFSRGLQVVPQNATSESATFFACSVGQRAYEDAKFGHGVFTNWIIDGLRHGAVPQADGIVDMGRLSSFVTQKVGDWAKAVSANGDFEVEQTPELVATQLSEPLVLMRVKRPLTSAPIQPTPPRLLVSAFPEGAQVSINGQRAGSGTVEKSLPTEGDYQITISAPGYAPVARSVKALGGYQNQLIVQLQPAASGAVATTDDPASKFYARAVAAEGQGQWEVAEQGYTAAIGANPKIFAAYEALGELHRLRNRNADAIVDALGLVANAPRGAHPLSLLSRAYSRYAQNGPGNDNLATTATPVTGYTLPRKPDEAVKLALRASGEALAADANSPEASLAQGYALAALDVKGKNKAPALAAFGKAIFLDESDPVNQLGLGYGLRFYAVLPQNEANQRADIDRAIASLKQAVVLRPNYYEAHRELAYCYMLQGNADAALEHGNLANANRGAASNADEVAGMDVAMAGMHQKAAENSTGAAKAAHEQASEGYMADAQDTARDKEMKVAMQVLNGAGVSTSLASYIPNSLRPLMDIRGTVENKIRDKIKIPGIGGLRLP